MKIDVPQNLAQYIQTWNHERKTLEETTGEPHGMREANRDSAIDLLHSVATLIENTNAPRTAADQQRIQQIEQNLRGGRDYTEPVRHYEIIFANEDPPEIVQATRFFVQDGFLQFVDVEYSRQPTIAYSGAAIVSVAEVSER